MLENFLNLVDPRLHSRSGSVFYSGRSAFSASSDLYILGLNPGGCPIRQFRETVGQHINAAKGRPEGDWSEYCDESWSGKTPGTHKMQPRVLHLLKKLGRNPHTTPSSNVVFVRSGREADLMEEKASLLAACWPVHQEVIGALNIRTILCLGSTSGNWTREMLGAHSSIGSFVEDNNRRWKSQAYESRSGHRVITVSHPSIADWTSPAADPSDFVANLLSKD